MSCGICNQSFFSFEMSNVIHGLCGYCAQQRIHAIDTDQSPFGDNSLSFAQLASMAQQLKQVVMRFKAAWVIR